MSVQLRDDVPIEELAEHAAFAKLARVLDVDESEIAVLHGADLDDVRALRDAVSDRLQREDGPRLERVVRASGLIPASLAASIGERMFGAALCARMVPLIDPTKVGGFTSALSVPFMADITARTDPRLVGPLVEHLDLHVMQAIANELVRRGDHLTLSHFVGHIPADTVAAILAAITEDDAVVRIARFVEDMDELSPVVALLPEERLEALITAVVSEDLWAPGLHMFGRLQPDQVLRFATRVVDMDPVVLTAAIDGFDRHELWVEGLGVLSTVDGAHMARIASVLIGMDDRVVLSAITAFDRHGLWAQGLAILTELDGADVARLASLLPALPSEVLQAVIAAFGAHDLWADGLRILAELEGPHVRAIASALAAVDGAVIDGAVEAALRTDLWEPLVRAGVAAEELPADVRATLAGLLERHGTQAADAFDAAAVRLGHAGLRERLLADG